MSTHLAKRGEQYYIQRRVPLALVEMLGRKVIQMSLGQTDRRKAAEICRARSVAIDGVFLAATADLGKPADATLYHLNRLGIPLAEYWRRQLTAAATGSTGTHEHTPLPAPIPVRFTPSARDLDSLVRKWAQERKPTKGAIGKSELAVSRFKLLVGDMPVTKVKKASVVLFKDKMLEKHTEKTTNHALTVLSVLFSFSISQDWIEVNPFKGVKIRIADEDAPRLPFTEEHLNLIFKSDVYTKGYRPEGCADETAYWLPLLGLFTGARVEELCQLAPCDIQEHTYRDESGDMCKAWVFVLTNKGKDQRLKNKGSRRRLPVHRELLARGFIEYVESRKDKERVFPIRRAPNGRHATNWSGWFHKYMRDTIGIKDKKRTYHSLRHSFKDIARECSIDKGIRDAAQGHSEGGAAGEYGDEYYPLRPMVEAFAKFKVHGVTLPDAPQGT